MRYSLLFPILLAGCMTPRPAALPAGPCHVDQALRMRFIGTEFTLAMRPALQAGANARIARVLRPGDAATMDFRPDRLNIQVDEAGQVEGLTCG